MKFKIRFADQIVGFFIVLSLLSLAFVAIMLGRSQRWFASDIAFYTTLPSAGGVNRNMPVQYLGFTIGNIQTFHLTENDEVKVVFSVFEEYRDRVRQGSMVEMVISPVGLGSQFLLHTGRGDELAEGAFVPVLGSPQARALIRQGLAIEPRHDDSISLIMNRASSVLDELNRTLAYVNEAFGTGSDETEIGRIVGNLHRASETLPRTIEETIVDLAKTIESLNAELAPILANVNVITGELVDPDSVLLTVLNTEGEVYTNLLESLNSVSGILQNLDRAAAFVPAQLPQVAGLILDLRTTMKTAEDVLVALTNNPLLRRGVPGRPETQPAGTGPRNIRF